MKYLNIVFILILFSGSIHAQERRSLLSVSYDNYFEDHRNYNRNGGFSFAYKYEKSFNDLISLNIGLSANVSYEDLFIDRYDYDYSSGRAERVIFGVDKFSGYSFGWEIPLNLKTRLYRSKFYLITGLSLLFDRSMIDNGFPYTGHTFHYYNDYDIDSQIPNQMITSYIVNAGISYKAWKRIDIFGNYKFLANKEYTMTYFNIGMEINISKLFTDSENDL